MQTTVYTQFRSLLPLFAAAAIAGCGGGGSDTPAPSKPAAAAELRLLLATAIPTETAPVVAIKSAANRWIVRTPVQDGGPGDFAEYEMYDANASNTIGHKWAVHSIRGVFKGIQNHFLEQDRENLGNVSTLEFAFLVGRLADPLHDPRHYAYFGFGHGNLDFLDCEIKVGSNGVNLCNDSPVGAYLRGDRFTYTGTYHPKLLDGTRLGTTVVSHTFTRAGLMVDHAHEVTAKGVGSQNSYAALLPLTGIDRIKPMGLPATVVGRHDGSMAGSWGAITRFAAFNTATPRQLLELTLPFGGPGADAASWEAATETKTFALDNLLQSKLYINWRSGDAAVPMVGMSRHRAGYSVRYGDPL